MTCLHWHSPTPMIRILEMRRSCVHRSVVNNNSDWSATFTQPGFSIIPYLKSMTQFFEFLWKYYPVCFSWAAAVVALATFRRWMPLHFKVLALFVFFYAFADTAGSII